MAITKSILKNNRQQYVVHLYATANGDSSTIALTDLVRSDETTSGTLVANIHSIWFGTTDTSIITVSRGSTSIGIYNGCEFVDYSGFGMPLGSSTSITISFNGLGWMILDIHKKSGYVEPLTNVGV